MSAGQRRGIINNYGETVGQRGKLGAVQVRGPDHAAGAVRQIAGLTGTHVGCDTSQCGACVVQMGDRSVKSCTMLAVQASGETITTIEGLAAEDGTLHPMQQAFRDNHGLQCGFCTPGMVISALDLVSRIPQPSESDIRAWLDGNLCRCTGYHNIVKAIGDGAAAMRG